MLIVQPDQLKKLPPLSTVLRGGKRGTGGQKTVPVTLAARTTAIGTLELYCVAKSGGHRWRLEFSTRDASTDDDESSPASGERQLPDINGQPSASPIAEEKWDDSGWKSAR